ncbi:MAG: Ig-like domain-containing protein, partial [Thermoguttaceae bacterium]
LGGEGAGGSGPYVLKVTGHNGSPAPFAVARTDPHDGQSATSSPARIVVDFQDSVLVGSLQASDLSVDGIPALGVRLVDGDTAVFELPPRQQEGPHDVAIAYGEIVDLQGTPVEAFQTRFIIDRTGPRIIESSLVAGNLVPPGPLIFEIVFDEPLRASYLNPAEVLLYSPLIGVRLPDTLTYDAERLALTVGFDNLVPGPYQFMLSSRQMTSFIDLAGNALDGETDAQTTLPSGNGVPEGDFVVYFEVRQPTVVGRHLFYNDSSFDGDNPEPNDADDPAIAPDKAALLPGETATLANYSSYDRGINGVMIDVVGLADAENLNAADDFRFRVGNTNEPGNWPDAPEPLSVTVRPGAGVGGTDRVTILWDEHRIERQWLQVTVRATDNTGLAQPDVFYFGNTPGEAGDQSINAIVNATDEIVVRNFQHGPMNPAAIVDRYDYNRDKQVNATDRIIARNNQTNPITMLRLITAPQTSAGKDASTAKVDWQFPLEQTESSDGRTKHRRPAAEAVDRLLATYVI